MSNRAVCKCRSCGARIMWKKTENRKWIPVDYDDELWPDINFDPDRMVTHFETCPNADEHRGRGKQDEGPQQSSNDGETSSEIESPNIPG